MQKKNALVFILGIVCCISIFSFTLSSISLLNIKQKNSNKIKEINKLTLKEDNLREEYNTLKNNNEILRENLKDKLEELDVWKKMKEKINQEL